MGRHAIYTMITLLPNKLTDILIWAPNGKPFLQSLMYKKGAIIVSQDIMAWKFLFSIPIYRNNMAIVSIVSLIMSVTGSRRYTLLRKSAKKLWGRTSWEVLLYHLGGVPVGRFYCTTLEGITLARYYCTTLEGVTLARYYCTTLEGVTLARYYCTTLELVPVKRFYCN